MKIMAVEEENAYPLQNAKRNEKCFKLGALPLFSYRLETANVAREGLD